MSAAVIEKKKKKIRWSFNEPAQLLQYKNVHTVCEESRCPNRNECSSLKVATFLIGGRECTRSCKFCHIATAKPIALEQIADKEHDDVLAAARAGKYKYLVITSVARDDDEAGLARHFARITRSLVQEGIDVELLIPDFHMNPDYIALIAESQPTVIAHNIETVRRLSPRIRPQAEYDRSLSLFKLLKSDFPQIIRKSAIMVGLGENKDEIGEALDDMKAAHVDIVSIGQYLRPSEDQAPVARIYSDAEFLEIEQEVESRDFITHEVGAFVRSSYLAEKSFEKLRAEVARRSDD